jgi:peptidoglycan/LPS O-acetylase OafA/YrhL
MMTDMVTKRERFKNVEFLRFLFAILIVAFHCFVKISPKLFLHSNICVDFFFIIAGFFLFKGLNIAQDTFDFIKKKFFRLAPMAWFIILFLAICSLFSHNIHFKFQNELLRFFLMNGMGFGRNVDVAAGHTWFISVLMWVSVFYFQFIKVVDKRYHGFLIWLLVVSAYSLHFNFNNFGTGGHGLDIFYIFDVGVLRGVAGVGLGYFVYQLYQKDFLKNVSKRMKLFLSVLEIYFFVYILHYSSFSKHLPAKTGFAFIIAFVILFYLFLVKQGILSNLLENNFSNLLGSYSFSIYMMHPCAFLIFRNFIHSSFLETHKTVYFLILVVFAVALGILVHYIFEKPISKFIKSKI